MAFTSPTDDIGLQPNVMPLSFECSGTISAGQGVQICGAMKVKAPGGANAGNYVSGCVGVAETDCTDGNWIGVLGPGNIVRLIISGATACEQGEILHCVSPGKWAYKTPGAALAAPGCSGVRAIALENQATANGTCRALLF